MILVVEPWDSIKMAYPIPLKETMIQGFGVLKVESSLLEPKTLQGVRAEVLSVEDLSFVLLRAGSEDVSVSHAKGA